MARLLAGPNPDPEPGGLRRLTAILHNQYKLDLETFNAKPGEGTLQGARIALLTGTTAFKLTDPARLELKTFVHRGGTLIIDAAGGSAAFAASAEEELRNMFGAEAKDLDTPFPPESPLYNLPGEKIESATYRVFARCAAAWDQAADAPRHHCRNENSRLLQPARHYRRTRR